jgi:predicted secreted Zn-dependent protease
MWLLALACTLPEPPPEPIVVQHEAKVAEYPVRGLTAEAVDAELKAYASVFPASGDGERYPAHAHREVTWDYDCEPFIREWRAVRWKLTLETTILAPRWEPDGVPTAAERERIERMIGTLRTHEDVHVELNVAATDDLRAAFEAIGPRPSCDDLREAVNATYDANSAALEAKQADYDRVTEHGRAQERWSER